MIVFLFVFFFPQTICVVQKTIYTILTLHGSRSEIWRREQSCLRLPNHQPQVRNPRSTSLHLQQLWLHLHTHLDSILSPLLNFINTYFTSIILRYAAMKNNCHLLGICLSKMLILALFYKAFISKYKNKYCNVEHCFFPSKMSIV